VKLVPTFAALLVGAAPAAAQTSATPAPPTRAELTSGLQSNFKAMDTNGDGALDKAEIAAANAKVAAEATAALNRRLEQEFAQLDSNKDGQLSLAEFKAGVPAPKASPAEATLQQLDTNKNQRISFEEFSASYLAAFDQLDRNKDGTISASEQQQVAGR